MGQIESHRPVLLIAAAFSRYGKALDWAKQTLIAAWGPIALESDRFVHDETKYYEREMGAGLLKTFFAFDTLVHPAKLVDFKLQANEFEQQYASQASHVELRPLNIDPGYLTEAKLVLASTKDRDHRLYLDRGIYAENTIFFRAGGWQNRPWTYPDYQRADYHSFFTQCRDWLRSRYRSAT